MSQPSEQDLAAAVSLVGLATARCATIGPDPRLTLRVLAEAMRQVVTMARIPPDELQAILQAGFKGEPTPEPERPRIVRIH